MTATIFNEMEPFEQSLYLATHGHFYALSTITPQCATLYKVDDLFVEVVVDPADHKETTCTAYHDLPSHYAPIE